MSREANEGAFSAVCRDSLGVYLGALAIRIFGIADPASLEALACREAMALALNPSMTLNTELEEHMLASSGR